MKEIGMKVLRILTMCGLVIACAGTVNAAERKPNVIVIYTDDQGSVDAGCYGATDLETPSIDALAKRGIRFTQFYAPAPVCSPSRAGMLTGRYPIRAGVPGNVGSKKGSVGMPAEQITMAEMFKSAGYGTAHIGKWHLGHEENTMPLAQGFDYSYGHMGGCIDNFSHFFYWSGPNIHDLYRNGKEVFADGEFFPDLMVQEAGQYMEDHRDEPFFMYFAMNVPHYPYQGSPWWLEKYNKDGVKYPRNLYNAFMSTLDERIGDLLARVDALGLSENTIVVFQSDHGHSNEERAHNGGGSSGPYRGAKFSMFEGGLRVPAIISWPGHLEEGTVRDQMSHGSDWFPTIAELCKIDITGYDIDGKSLVNVLKSPEAPSPHDHLIWANNVYGGYRWAVRKGDWKLLGNPRDSSNKAPITKDDKLFLVNLKDDIGEMNNVAKAHPEKLDELNQIFKDWEKTVKN